MFYFICMHFTQWPTNNSSWGNEKSLNSNLQPIYRLVSQWEIVWKFTLDWFINRFALDFVKRLWIFLHNQVINGLLSFLLNSLLFLLFLWNMNRRSFKVRLISLKNHQVFLYNYHCHHLVPHSGNMPCNLDRELFILNFPYSYLFKCKASSIFKLLQTTLACDVDFRTTKNTMTFSGSSLYGWRFSTCTYVTKSKSPQFSNWNVHSILGFWNLTSIPHLSTSLSSIQRPRFAFSYSLLNPIFSPIMFLKKEVFELFLLKWSIIVKQIKLKGPWWFHHWVI